MRIFCYLSVIAVFFITPLCSMAAGYTNPDYGFDVDIDPEMKICTTPPPGSNHGFAALFRSDSCEAIYSQPRVDLFVQYNVLAEAKTTKELSVETCGGAIRTGKRSAGVDVFKCRLKINGNLYQSRYFFLRPTSDEWNGNWVVFYVDLYTATRPTEQDIKIVYTILDGIHWGSSTAEKK
jgi:hypothetical protein